MKSDMNRREALLVTGGALITLSACNSSQSSIEEKKQAPQNKTNIVLKDTFAKRDLEVYAAFSVQKKFFPWFNNRNELSAALSALSKHFHGITNLMGEYEWRFEHDWDPKSKVGDRLLNLAKTNNLKYRMNEVYSWEFLPDINYLNVSQVEKILETRIKKLLAPQRRKSFSILGCVTEAIAKDGTLRKDGIIDRFGEEIIDFIFNVSHENAPELELIYEDAGLNHQNLASTRKAATARLKLIERLKLRNVPIGGFGDTAQITIKDWNKARWFYSELEDLGLNLHLTEFQTRYMEEEKRRINVTADRWRTESSLTYAQYLRFFNSFKAAKSVTFWTPFESWNSILHGFGNFTYANQPNARVGLFDINYKPNQTFFDIVEALEA